MTELSDYQRMVETPHRKRLEQIIQNQRGEIVKLRTALEPFAAQADIKGGTAAAEKFKALIVYMMEVNKPGDGVDIIYQFTTACLAARDALRPAPTGRAT